MARADGAVSVTEAKVETAKVREGRRKGGDGDLDELLHEIARKA